MPLAIDIDPELPEVTALKQRVREVAERYALQHNWCDVVKRALREAGITDDRKIYVSIDFTVANSETQQARKMFNITDLAGKSTEQQNAWVADQIAPKVMVAGTEVTLPVNVIDLNEIESVANNTTGYIDPHGAAIPEGYRHFYTEAGRVAHLFSPGREYHQALQEGLERGYNEETALDLALNTLHNYTGLCGDVSYYSSKRSTSTRSEGRVCAACTRRAQ